MIFRFLLISILVLGLSFASAQNIELGSILKSTSLRSFPDLNSEKTSEIPSGTAVQILSRTSDWILVAWPQGATTVKGWVESSQVLSSSKPLNPPAEATPFYAKAVEMDRSKDEAYRVTSDPTRSFYFPTALQQKKGNSHLRGFYLAGWHYEGIGRTKPISEIPF